MCTPKQVELVGGWLSELKTWKKGTAFALVCPNLSFQSQQLCLKRNLDFIDLAGNVFINVPGRLLLQRVGMSPRKVATPSYYRNPFSGTSSRILRVLLQKPGAWTLSEIVEELTAESRRLESPGVSFGISSSLASRVLRSLEEELLVVRMPTSFDSDQAVSERDLQPEGPGGRRSPVIVPNPEKLLARWAQDYKRRYRWYLRRSFKLPNPFGMNLEPTMQEVDKLLQINCHAFTGAAAANLTAPFVDADSIDLYISEGAGADNLRKSASGPSIGPDLRVIYAYDPGVFLYCSRTRGIPVVSDIQTYLDLYARGGRDLKQADYLLQERIKPMWRIK